MRHLAAGTALLLSLLLPVAAPVRAAEQPPAAPDVPAIVQALPGTPVVRAPGSIAGFDEAAVRRVTPDDVRIVLVPPRPLSADGDDDVYSLLSAAARERSLRLLLVRGTQVQVVGRGTVVPTDLPGARDQLGRHDVTEELLFGLRSLDDPRAGDDGVRRPLTTVPAPAALVRQVGDGLAADRTWVAPGVDEELAGARPLADRVPGLGVRVAVLAPLPGGRGWPDLLTPLASRFPGELVVVVRGSWLEATGPQQADADLVRDQVLGLYQGLLSESAVPAANLVGQYLDRYQVVRSGVAYGRPQVQPVTVRDLFGRWAPRVALAVAILVGACPLLYAVAVRRRRRRARDSAYRQQAGSVLAEVAALSVALVDTPAGTAGSAAERHAAALALLEQAARTRDPEVLRAAAGAAAEARRLLVAAT